MRAPHQQFSKLFPKDRVGCVFIFLPTHPCPSCLGGIFYWGKHARVQVIHWYIFIYSRGNISCLMIFFFNLPLLESWGCRAWGNLSPPRLSSLPSPSKFLLFLQNPAGRSPKGQWGVMVLSRLYSILIWAIRQSGRVKWIHYFHSFLERRESWACWVRVKWLFCTAVMRSL